MGHRATGSLKELVRTHRRALHTSSWLSTHFRENYQSPMATDVKPEFVVKVLHKSGIQCVLMGTHALNTYRDEARATQDVDVLVRKSDVTKAVKALSKAFPKLEVTETPVVTRFVDPETKKTVLDVMKPTQGVLPMVFRHCVPVGKTHSIPDLEMALVSKFAAMVSPFRRPDKKMIDGGDFMNIVMNNRLRIDIGKLRRLADKANAGGSEEIAQMIDTIDAGKTLSF